MAVDFSQVRVGQDVFGMDGEKIGTVLDVAYPAVPTEDSSEGDMAATPTGLTAEMVGSTRSVAADATGSDTGTLPLGATTSKGRGTDTNLRIAADHGDISTYSGSIEGGTPSAGGLDAMRGYGVEGSTAGDRAVQPTQASATGMLDAAGSTSGLARPEAGVTADLALAREAGTDGGEKNNTPGADAGMQRLTAGGTRRNRGSFTVQDPGMLGVGGRILHVPFSAVDRVIAGEGVRLRMVSEEARQRFSGRPGLEIDDDADVTPF